MKIVMMLLYALLTIFAVSAIREGFKLALLMYYKEKHPRYYELLEYASNVKSDLNDFYNRVYRPLREESKRYSEILHNATDRAVKAQAIEQIIQIEDKLIGALTVYNRMCKDIVNAEYELEKYAEENGLKWHKYLKNA